MRRIENWSEVPRGMFTYAVSDHLFYQILVLDRTPALDVQFAPCNLYRTVDYTEGSYQNFERELILGNEAMYKCIERAADDRREMKHRI